METAPPAVWQARHALHFFFLKFTTIRGAAE